MPAMGATIPSDQDMADLLLYIRNSWGNKAGDVTVDQVTQIRAKIADRTAPWTEPELLALP